MRVLSSFLTVKFITSNLCAKSCKGLGTNLKVTDTEVLVHGWSQWHEDLVPRLRGMFGIAIWDVKKAAFRGAG